MADYNDKTVIISRVFLYLSVSVKSEFIYERRK